MALSKKRQRFVTHDKSEGTIVSFHENCYHIQKGDIPTDTVKVIIPNNTRIICINEGSIPKSVISRFKKNELFTKYEGGYYIGTEGNPYFMLVDFSHSAVKNGHCLIWGRKIHPDCEVIYPSLITNGAAMIREERSSENATLGELIEVLSKKHKEALTLDDSNSWSTSRGKLLDANGNVVASLKEEIDIYCFFFHGGMWWKSKELFPIAYPGALGYRWFKLMKDEIGLRVYISVKRKGEEELVSIGAFDMTASSQIFNFVCNYCNCFDSECG